MRTNETGGEAAGFPDCRDPDCEACRASREHGVTWARERCLGAIKTIDVNSESNRAAYDFAKRIELHALLLGRADGSVALSGLIGAAISIANRTSDPDAVLAVTMDALQVARDILKKAKSGALPS